MASVTICDRLARDGQVVCYIVRVHVRFMFYIKTCAICNNASLLRMLRNVVGLSILALPGSILGTSDEELPRRPANQTRQDRQPYLTDPPFVTDHEQAQPLSPDRR